MSVELLDHPPGPPLSKVFSQFQLDDALRHGADGEEHDGDAEEDQEWIEDPAGMAERMNLVVTHGADGDHGHVERIEQWVVFDDRESRCAHR